MAAGTNFDCTLDEGIGTSADRKVTVVVTVTNDARQLRRVAPELKRLSASDRVADLDDVLNRVTPVGRRLLINSARGLSL